MAMHKWKARVYMEGSSRVVEVETEAQDIFKAKKNIEAMPKFKKWFNQPQLSK